MKAFIRLQHGSRILGTLLLELFDKDVPKTVQNFVTLLQRTEPGKGYLGCSMHRIIKGFMAQGGDFTNGDGTGGFSIYGKTFDDENFKQRHNQAGILSMANAGSDTNGSQFFVTFRSLPHLDGKHVVFGKVDLAESIDVLDALEQVQTLPGDRPREPVTIFECGIVEDELATTTGPTHVEIKDIDEIELDKDTEPHQYSFTSELPANSIEEAGKPKTKSDEIKLRLRKLKQKMNQARQLNKQAVKEEGERLSTDGASKDRKQQAAIKKNRQDSEWEASNSKALEIGDREGLDANLLIERASESVEKARKRAEKDEIIQFEVNDYHNPEGQHRNYLRNVKSLPHNTMEKTRATYDPVQNEADPTLEREGARRLATEMHRRIEKRQKRERDRKRKEISEDSNVSHINQRNKKFNEKINRTYDKHTAEIRQNLERGTAL